MINVLKLFFIVFFVAELIIAITLMLKIRQFNKCVNNWNNLILKNKNKIGGYFEDVRTLIEYFSVNLIKVRELIKRKREEYLIKVAKTALIYSSIFLLKGKYKKSVLAYQFVKEVYEGIKEA